MHPINVAASITQTHKYLSFPQVSKIIVILALNQYLFIYVYAIFKTFWVLYLAIRQGLYSSNVKVIRLYSRTEVQCIKLQISGLGWTFRGCLASNVMPQKFSKHSLYLNVYKRRGHTAK